LDVEYWIKFSFTFVFNDRNLEGNIEIKSAFWIGTSIMLLLAFGLLYLFLFYKKYFYKMKQKEAQLLLRTALDSEKEERKRIAADLHDSVSSDLSAIRNYLVLILKSENDSQKIDLLVDLKEGVEIAIENTRLISYKLMPPMLEQYGFTVALGDYVDRLNKNSSVHFQVNCTDELFTLNSTVSYELYRIIQEFTTNMLKYGSVKNCSFFISVLQNKGFVEIVDDGDSFDFYKALEVSKGLGLRNISGRLKIIGATLVQREVVVGNHYVISLMI
jgi:signal transduction histidine kinase